MIQDILPMRYHVEYCDLTPEADDTVFVFSENKICFADADGETVLPKIAEVTKGLSDEQMKQIKFRYLFSIDERRFFMPDIHNTIEIKAPAGYEPQDQNLFRTLRPQHLGFAGITAYQLYLWYSTHKYCGRCGTETSHSATERAVLCPKCELLNYPRINPVIIVGVINGEDLLVTRYKYRAPGQYSLVAGFIEIGETMEECVIREVREETGISVKNIRYYKSQPWGFSSSLISGFFCELDGDPTVIRDDIELAEALWLRRDALPPPTNTVSITAEMIEMFRTGKIR